MAPTTTTGAQRLLLAVDEPLAVAALTPALERARFSVTAATSATEALEQVRHATFSLAVLDCAVLAHDGSQLADALSQQSQPFIILSSRSEEDLVERAVAAGALAYLIKPVDPEGLVPTVRAAVHRARELASLKAEKERLSDVLQHNREISVAVGLIMAHRGLSGTAAFEVLRQQARRTRRSVRELALEITAGADAIYAIPV